MQIFKDKKTTCLNYKKRNSAEWKLISSSTAIVDTKNQFSNLYLFWEKNYKYCRYMLPFAI